MAEQPKEIKFEQLRDTGDIDRLEEEIRNYYLSLSEPAMALYERLMNLYLFLLLALARDLPGATSRFVRGSPVHQLIASAACGSFRALRVSRKLLLYGHFPDMHMALRMVEQWSECLLIAEGYPEAAERVLKTGVTKNHLQKATRSPDLKSIYSQMGKTYEKLSRRAHVRKEAINLGRRAEPSGGLVLSGVASEEMFRKDAHALAVMAMNATELLLRHFSQVPADWAEQYSGVKRELLALGKT